jgi:hypothetical protein
MTRKCVLCQAPRVHPGLFCLRCAKTYDRWNAKSDGTSAALIEWVARRVRYQERQRAREAKLRLGP